MHSVLYVDDEKSLLEIGKLFLEESGDFFVTVIDSAHEALDLINRLPFDAIISDYQMPEMDGISLLKEVRLKFGKIPFILFTGRGREEVVIQALNEGADFYLQKGGDPESQYTELMHKIRIAIQRHQHEKTIEASEKALRESQKRLADVIQFLPDATMAIDSDKRVIIWNRAIEQMTGIPAAEMIGKGDYAYTVPFYGVARPQLMDLVFEDSEEIAAQYPGIDRDGTTLSATVFCNALYHNRGAWVYAKASPLFDSSGKVIGAIERIRDVTGQREADGELARRNKELNAAYGQLAANQEELRQNYESLEKSQALLALSEERYRLIIDSSRDFIYSYDRKGRFTSANRSLCEAMGLEEEQITGKTHEELGFPPDQCREWDELHQRVYRTNATVISETSTPMPDGAFHNFEVVLNPLHDPRGMITGISGTTRDITERKKAEAALTLSEAKYRGIFENAITGIFRTAPDGILIDANDAFAKMFGYRDVVEMLATGVNVGRDLYRSPKDRSQVLELLETKGIMESREFPVRKKDGTGFWISVSARAVRDINGQLDFYEGTCVDITGRIVAEEQIKQSDERFSAAFNFNPDPVAVTDIETGRIIEANPSFCTWSGYNRDELIGKTTKELDFWVNPDERDEFIRALKNHDDIVEKEVVFKIRSGEKRVVMFTMKFITIGNREYLFTRAHDLTGRKRAEEALKSSHERIKYFIDSNIAGVIIATESGKIIEANDYYLQMIGYSRKEFKSGQVDWRAITPPEWLQADEKALEELAEKGICTPYEKEYARRDGTRVSVFLSDAMLPGPQKQIVAFVLDITERKRVEEALRLSEERYRQVVENAAEAIVIAQDNTVVYTNPRTLAMLSVTHEKLLNRPFVDFIHPEDRALVFERYMRRIQGDVIPDHYDFRLVRENGEVIWVHISAVRIEWNRKPATLNLLSDITELKQAEVQLRESEAKYRAIFSAESDAIFVVDQETGKIVDCNDAVTRMYGYAREEVIGMQNTELSAEPEMTRTATADPVQLVPGRNHRKKSGFIFPVEIAADVIQLQGRSVIIATCRDVTYRHEAEKELRENKELLDHAENVAHIGSWRYNLVTDKVQWSDGMCRLFEADPKEYGGDIWPVLLKRVHPEDLPLLEETIRQVRETGIPRAVEYRLVLPGGKERVVKGEGLVEYDKSGAPMAIIGFYQDITERKRAEAETKLDEARLETLLRINQHPAKNIQELLDFSLEEAISLTGSRIGYIYFYNEAKNEFTLNTWSREVMRQCTVTEPQTVYQLDKTGIWGEAVRQRKPVMVNDFAAQNPLKKGLPEGHAPLHNYLTIPVIIDDHIVAVVGVANKPSDYNDSDIRQLNLMMDAVWKIVERKNSEYALRKANQQLNLLGSITRHDINNKITVLLGYIGILQKNFADPDLVDYLEKMESATTAIQSQIAFTKVYQELGTLEPQWVALENVMPVSPAQVDIRLNADVSGIEVYADPMLGRVFFNLLDNSVRHGRHVSDIRVFTRLHEKGMTIVWEDNGIGVPAHEKEKIFESGYGKNTGHGMFLVREILLLTGITIQENGEPGRGARFEILVPEGAYRIINGT